MRGGRAAGLLSWCAAALLAGCAFGPVEPAMTSALIERLPATVPQRPRGAATVLVLRTQARPAFDTTQMAYSLRPHHIGFYREHQWAERPAQMLQPLLVRTLERTGAYAAVLSPPHAGAVGFAVQAEVVELLQDFGVEPPLLRLALRVQVSDGALQAPAVRDFSVLEPLPARNAEGGVLAANAAMERALRDIAGFVLERAR
jgi:cholesterol transport system auxiliary component